MFMKNFITHDVIDSRGSYSQSTLVLITTGTKKH